MNSALSEALKEAYATAPAAAAQIPLPAAAAILAGCVISDAPPMTVIAEAGLQLAQDAPI